MAAAARWTPVLEAELDRTVLAPAPSNRDLAAPLEIGGGTAAGLGFLVSARAPFTSPTPGRLPKPIVPTPSPTIQRIASTPTAIAEFLRRLARRPSRAAKIASSTCVRSTWVLSAVMGSRR